MEERSIVPGEIPVTTCGMAVTKEAEKTKTGKSLYSLSTTGIYSADEIKVIGNALSDFTDEMFDDKTKPFNNIFQLFAYRSLLE